MQEKYYYYYYFLFFFKLNTNLQNINFNIHIWLQIHNVYIPVYLYVLGNERTHKIIIAVGQFLFSIFSYSNNV